MADSNGTPVNPPKQWDAVVFSASLAPGGSHSIRANKALDLVEPLVGKPAHVSDIGGGNYFARRDPAHKLNFPVDSDRAFECRYTFEAGPGGIKLGTLKPGA
jgi:hypothetical protein